ncbi:DNA replication/repair protein RecF [Bacteroidota bacterium]
MHLKNLSVTNFKNYEQSEFEFIPKINCIVGDNGVGKTNLLDAIYYLSFTKSYFNPVDYQNINNKNEFFVVEGDYQINGKTEHLYCGAKRHVKKTFKRNNKDYKRISEHIGLIPLVIITPTDINLIIGASEERRRYINSVISQYKKSYLNDVIDYNKALAHRNKLLKNFSRDRYFDKDNLDVWDMQLIPLGKRIFDDRKYFIDKLLPIFSNFYDLISQSKEEIKLTYISDLNAENFEELLKNNREKDRITQYTNFGIHRDELNFEISDLPLKKSGSQGQQKTFLIALKFAQFSFLKEISGIKPILLLDDIFDKLDSSRVKEIVKLVADQYFGQIFITDTNPERIEKIVKQMNIEYNIFHIKPTEK